MYSTYSDACTSQRGRKEAHVCLFWATIFQGWPVSGRRNASMTLSTHVGGKRPGCLTRWRSSLHHCRSRVYKILEATLVRVLHSRRTSKQAQKSWPAFHALCRQIATCKGSHTTWWSPLNSGNITNCSTFHQRYRLRQLHQLNFPLQISFPYDVAIKWAVKSNPDGFRRSSASSTSISRSQCCFQVWFSEPRPHPSCISLS